MLDHREPDRASRLRMARCGQVAFLSGHNDLGHRNSRRNCYVRSLLAPGGLDPDPEHSKTAAEADQAGSPPASTPLQSPRFLEGVKRAVSAVYMMRSYLWPALCAAGKDADEETRISTCQLVADDARAQVRS